MNYLGHLFLSGKNEQLLIGNFIGDYVKGRQHENFPEEIQKGILLHRKIDHYTDHNQHWIEIREMLRPIYNRHAGIVADMFVDHFLAANWNLFSDIQLSWYAKWVYAVFLRNYDVMPIQVQGFLPYLIQHRRLQSYAEISGIEMSLKIMSSHSSLPDNTKMGIQNLEENYSDYNQISMLFLDEVLDFVAQYNTPSYLDYK